MHHFLANLLAQSQKMSEKSVFRKASSPEMTSQSFPVSWFWSRGFVPHRKWNLMLLVHYNTGKENRYRNVCFAILISKLWKFYRANKKRSVIYTLRFVVFLKIQQVKPQINSIRLRGDIVVARFAKYSLIRWQNTLRHWGRVMWQGNVQKLCRFHGVL